ncbi:Uncharacterized protein OBRU01_22869, partial [Operophtera brumata]
MPQSVFIWITRGSANEQEKYFQENRQVAKAIVEVLQDTNFNKELLFDLKNEHQVYLNRTTALVIKYIVKREVDYYRSRRTDAISRKIYSSLIMKLIDIAKVCSDKIGFIYFHEVDYYRSRRTDAISRKIYSSLIMKLIDIAKVFHAIARLYDIMFTYHLRNTVNYAIRSNALDALRTKPAAVGAGVVAVLKALGARLLPAAELVDLHLAHSSPVFKDTCPP